MLLRIKLVCFVVILLGYALCVAQEISSIVRFPTKGEVRIEAYGSQRYPGSYPFLEFKESSGKITRFEFLLGKQYESDVLLEYRMPVRFMSLSLEGVHTPIIVGVLGLQGGSDSAMETIFVGESKGELKDLLPEHPVTNTEDIICIGNFGADNKASVLVTEFIFDDAHPEPHHYIISKYDWNGTEFEKSFEGTTKKKYSTGKSALAEYGYICKSNLTYLLVPDVY